MRLFERRCVHCRFAVIDAAPHCRKNPPWALDATNATFPLIRLDWWCSAYRRHWRRWWRGDKA
jgi:hypothetical protein